MHEFFLDPAREDDRADGEVGVVSYPAPQQGDQRGRSQLHSRRNADQVAAIARKYVFCEAASAGGRHHQHHDPDHQLPREQQELVADCEKGHDQRIGHQVARTPRQEGRRTRFQPKFVVVAPDFVRRADDVRAGLSGRMVPAAQEFQFENFQQQPFQPARIDEQPVRKHQHESQFQEIAGQRDSHQAARKHSGRG